MNHQESLSNSNADLPIFVKWIDFLKWLLLMTDKLPKKVRFTFSDRLNNLALDIVEYLIEARYTRQKLAALNQVNLGVEKIRVLMRIGYELRLISHKTYEQGIMMLGEIGKMIGGWIKQQKANQ